MQEFVFFEKLASCLRIHQIRIGHHAFGLEHKPVLRNREIRFLVGRRRKTMHLDLCRLIHLPLVTRVFTELQELEPDMIPSTMLDQKPFLGKGTEVAVNSTLPQIESLRDFG